MIRQHVAQMHVVGNYKYNVICPYCNGNVLIDSTGIWNCCHCKNSFEYREDNRIRKYDDNLEDDRNLKNGFLDCLYKIATFGGKATYRDEKMLDYAAAVLKIEPYVINSIKAEYMDNTLNKYYEILGCK